MITEKKCKGQGKAKGYGCNKMVNVKFRKYGLGLFCCYSKWLSTSEHGKEILNKAIGKAKVKLAKDIKATNKKIKRELNVSSAMRLADTYFSRYIRLEHSLHGDCTCYTCGKVESIKLVDNGHYLKREHKATRYHEDNCRPQCKTCNGDIKHNGKQAEFRVGLTYEIGDERVIELEELARTTIPANYTFYRELSDKYRVKVNELQRKMKVKYW